MQWLVQIDQWFMQVEVMILALCNPMEYLFKPSFIWRYNTTAAPVSVDFGYVDDQ
jgi:hypothetical protein